MRAKNKQFEQQKTVPAHAGHDWAAFFVPAKCCIANTDQVWQWFVFELKAVFCEESLSCVTMNWLERCGDVALYYW
ncbi:MAG: hypothetical protein EBU59_06825 [Planctomycetia bacterium]|nr:hypothetical protein [Planctomycetia bacterium]